MRSTTLNLNAGPLMVVNQLGTQTASVQPAPQRSHTAAAASGSDQVVILRPRPLLWVRKTLTCSWCGYLLISPWSNSFKLDCCLVALIILGTFCTTTVSTEQIEWHYRFGFLPVYRRHLSLKDQTTILTGWEERSGLGEALLLGLWGLCFAPLADWLSPFPGGEYRLWLKDTRGQRVLIWRGRVARTFHRNHGLLSRSTGLPSQRTAVSC